jgi:hypothetical protein
MDPQDVGGSVGAGRDVAELCRCQAGKGMGGVSAAGIVPQGPLHVQGQACEAFGPHHLACCFQAEDRVHRAGKVSRGQGQAQAFAPMVKMRNEVVQEDLTPGSTLGQAF